MDTIENINQNNKPEQEEVFLGNMVIITDWSDFEFVDTTNGIGGVTLNLKDANSDHTKYSLYD